MIQRHLIAEAAELCLSRRWDDPNTPGSAGVEELHGRLASPAKYAEFRATPDGEFLLQIFESYENALNDDWLPFEILGLSLPNARLFIGMVARELESSELSVAVLRLKQSHDQLAKI